MRRSILARAIGASLCLPAAALAAPADDAAQREARSLDAIVVQAQIAYRDRSDAIAPTLSYDLEYFQRFEPLTVGDMLKRVPSVAFVSDVLEYDGARLRGLAPGYTQVLINGRKVPGAGGDRSFFVDRIPAELVKRIEIVRNVSPNRSGDAIAGALNIVLRDAWDFDGKYLRAGALRFSDGETKPTYGGVASGALGQGRLLAGFNVQGRYNPKDKLSLRFEEPGGDFVDREEQDDTRDGTDTSANLSWTHEHDERELTLTGFFVQTDREEVEHSLEFNHPTARTANELLSVNDQFEEIDQGNGALGVGYELDGLGGRNELSLDYARFSDDSVTTEEEIGYDDDDSPPSFDGYEGTRTLSGIDDRELAVEFEHERELGSALLAFGLDLRDKRRDTDLAVAEVEAEDEGDPLPPYADFEASASRIEEERLDPWLMLSGAAGALEWETGLRYETTDARIRLDHEDAIDNDYALLLPSAHLRWNLDDADRVSLSLGRSVRRPDFDFLLPQTLEEEYGDNDFVGNPLLDPETAWGLDVGFERRLGRDGIVGVNLFYREVSDLIELINTGEPSATALDDYEEEVEEFLDENPGATPTTPGYPAFDPDSFLYSAANVGDGEVYGIEFDVSTPLTAFGLPHTGVFLNASWLDSSVDDFLGERTFNDQADYVYNLGFIQDLPDWGAAFGASYRRQGRAFSRLLAEEVETRYGGDLEAFIEKRFGEHFSLRLTGSNLLDASKDEWFHKFDHAADQLDRDYDEYEIETETSGRVYQLIARWSF